MIRRSVRMNSSRLPLQLAFAAIALVLIATSAVTMLRLHAVQEEVRSIVENELASVQWVDEMRDDVDVMRRLVESHILADSEIDRAALEKKMNTVDGDYDQAATNYGPLATLPDEKQQWLRVQEEMSSIRQFLPEVLALSRQDQDVQATQRLQSLDDRFSALDRDTRALSDINVRQAFDSVKSVYALQRSAFLLAAGLGAIGLLLTLFIGMVVSSRLERRDERIRTYASELESRNRDLDAFAGRVAHDLRGPLTTISMAADNLLRKLPEERETSALLRRGVSRMEGLITDLLSLSRIDAYARLQRSNPAVVTAQLAEEVGPRLVTEHATMRIEVEPSTVVGSDGLLRQALWNLTDNALRYARPDAAPEIDIQGHPTEGHQYELTFTDNGAGMSDEETRQAFEPFFRGESAREKPGTGLGLSIVKRVMEANGGSVSVTSTRGKGTRFVMRLPTT